VEEDDKAEANADDRQAHKTIDPEVSEKPVQGNGAQGNGGS